MTEQTASSQRHVVEDETAGAVFAPVFIVGMPRSGTTLLSSILSSHPAIAISPETHFLNKWMPRFRRFDLEKATDFDRFWSAFVESRRFGFLGVEPGDVLHRMRSPSFDGVFRALIEAYAAKLGKPIGGEKTPAHHKYVGTLLEWYPAARIVVALRDPRAVVSSLRGTPWGRQFGVDLHALEWDRSVDALLRWRDDDRVRTVRYEELVSDPEGRSRELCRFLGVDFDARMLEERSPEDDFIRKRDGWARDHFTSTFRPIGVESIRKWERRLSRAEIRVIEQLTHGSMQKVGYAPVTDGLSMLERAELAASRFVRRGNRRLRQLIGGAPRVETDV